MKKLWNRLLNVLLRFVWVCSSFKRKAILIERYPLIGSLDADSSILIGVGSSQDLRRLKAAASEPYTVLWIREDMRAGDVLYDIGASVGAYSFIAARAHPGVTVYAFEPSAASFSSLLANVERNRLGLQVIPLSFVLAAKTGFTEFGYSSLESGATKHPGILGKGTAIAHQMVYVWALDDFVNTAKLLTPTHIKIDVDGVELGVLAGMRKTLKLPSLRLIQVEASQGVMGTFATVGEILSRAGFRLVETNRAHNIRATDYLFRRS